MSVTQPTRIPPHNLDAERAILGCVLLEGASVLDHVELEPAVFFTETHRAIFGAMRALAERGSAVSLVTVTDELHELGLLELAGGPAHLALCEEQGSTEHYLGRYIEIIKRDAARRQAIQVLTTAIGDLFGSNGAGHPAVNVLDLAARVADRLTALAQQADPRRAGRPPQHVAEVLDAFVAELDNDAMRPTFIPTPIPELNERLGGGTQPGEFVLMGGRPGTAKTALGIQWASLAAKMGFRTLVVSREMKNVALTLRLISQEANVVATALRKRVVSPDERARIGRHLPRLKGLPLWFDDTSKTIRQIQRAVRAGRFQFVVVDYLQLVRAPQEQQRRLEVTAVSGGLKDLAHDSEIGVLGLSSLRRLQTDKGKRLPPTVEDLKESGDLEADGDIVVLLHQPDADKRDRELHFAKLRGGEGGGKVTLDWQPQYVRFNEVPDPHLAGGREPGDDSVPF